MEATASSNVAMIVFFADGSSESLPAIPEGVDSYYEWTWHADGSLGVSLVHFMSSIEWAESDRGYEAKKAVERIQFKFQPITRIEFPARDADG